MEMPRSLREFEIDRLAVEHRKAAGDVKSAERHRNAGRTEVPREIEGARILVRLHPHQRQQAEIVVAPEAADQLGDVDAGIGLVDQVDIDLDVLAEHMPLGAIEGETVDRGERIRWDQGPPPANDVAVIVVMGRLDQDELKAALHNFSAPIFAARCHAKGIPADRLGAP